MVINIRGTSGSGKTTVVRGIMAKGLVTALGGTDKKPDAYQILTPDKDALIYVIGSYENICGGTDGISTQDEVCARIRTYAPQGHVLVEGLLMGHLFSRYAMLDRELLAQGIPFVWACLDTPLAVCLSRVEDRRAQRGTTKPFNPQNTIDKFHDVVNIYEKCHRMRESDWKQVKGYPMAKLDARWIDHTNAVDQVYSWL